MGKAVKSIAIGAAVIGAAFLTGGASLVPTLTGSLAAGTAAIGTVLSTTFLGGLALSAGASMVLSGAAQALRGAPKVPEAMLSRLTPALDPQAPRKLAFGETAFPVDIRYYEPSGTDQEYVDYVIAVAAHRVESIDEIWFEERQAWTSSGGVTSAFSGGYLAVETILEASSANYHTVNTGTKWGADERLTGCATVKLRLKRTGNSKKAESPVVNGLPSRVTIIGKGWPLYDPRLDSTNGGTGTHRPDDQSTWGTTDRGNKALHILNYLLGWKIGGKLSVGCGMPVERINLASFIAAANTCEESVTLAGGGTQDRYEGAGCFSDDDPRLGVLQTMLSACNGALRDSGGQISLDILQDDLADDPLALDDDDLLGPFSWKQTDGYPPNVIRGQYTDPDSLYQLVDYPEQKITNADGVTLYPDGIERAMTLDLPTVQDPARAQRLAKQALQRAQYPGTFEGEFSAKAWSATVGRVVNLSLETLGWSAKPFRVVRQVMSRTGRVALTLAEENAAIYAWDAEDVAGVSAATPTVYDPLNSPFILAAAEVGAAADAAQSAATAAQTDASSALTKIGNIVSDSVLDKSEKPDIVQRYTAITNEQAGIDAQATAYSITTEKTAYDTAVSALTTYLTGLSPAYDDTTADTAIVRTTFNDKFTGVYSARQALLNKIAEVAGTVAEWDNVSNSPRDGTNLFRRPKPEGGNLDGWLLGSTWSASNTPARGWVLKVTGLAANDDAVGTDWVAVQPGDVFHAEWETYKGTDGANGTLNLYADVGGLTQVAGSFDAILSVNSSSETASVWTGKRTATWMVPAGCYWARFRLSSRADHTTGTWWINAPKVASYAPGADVTRDGYAAGVQPGAVVLQTSGVGLLLGLQLLAQTVSDGTVVTFSPAFDRTPEVAFDISSLPALASGESYSVRAESLTASGFTTRVKKRTTGGTPVALSTGLGTAVVAGEDYQVTKGDSRDARDGVYNFRVKGQMYGEVIDLPDPEPSSKDGYLTLEFWAKVSSVWQSLGQRMVQTVGSTTGTEVFDRTYAMTCTNAIGDPAGNEFKVTVAARGYTSTTDKITELTSVSWQADGTAVTETAITQSVIAKVRPVNA